MSTLPNKQNQQFGMPGYRGQYLPLPPLPTYPYPMPQAPPTLPSAQGQVPVAAQAPPRSMGEKLRDPRFAALLSAIGARMSQPLGVGQTGWGRAGEAMSAGYNTLAAMNALQNQQARQHWLDQLAVRQEQRAQTESEAKVAATQAGTAHTQAQTAEIPKAGARQGEALKWQREYQRAVLAQEWDKASHAKERFEAELKLEQDKLGQRRMEHTDDKALKERELANQEKRTGIAATEASANAARLLSEAAKVRFELKTATESSDPKSKTAMETRLRGIPAQVTEINKVLELMNPGPEKMQLETMRDSLTADYNSLRQKLGYTQGAPAGAGGATGTRRKYNPATGKIE